MGYVKACKGRNGRVRYSAMDGDRSLGIFEDYDDAVAMLERCTQARRDALAEMDFASLVDEWMALPGLSPGTRRGYAANLQRHVVHVIGKYRAASIKASRFQALLDMLRKQGCSPDMVHQAKCAMSSVMSILVNERVIEQNPVRSCRTEPRRRKARPVLSPDDVQRIEQSLAPAQRLFARVLIESGMRFGEASELRVRDLALPGTSVTVRRAVADVSARFHPDQSSRFFVKEPKSGRERMTSVTRHTAAELGEWVLEHRLGPDDLVFPRSLVSPRPERPEPLPQRPPRVGEAILDGKGRMYPHGTLNAYTHCGCRCEECRLARAEYDRRRRKGQQRKSVADDHLPKDVWRRAWAQAVSQAGIGWAARTHDLRHASATWAVKAGVDLHTVKERLGHYSITVTEGYLHSMGGDQDRIGRVYESLLG